MHGTLVIVSGPSGVGKDSAIDRWEQANPRVERVVACTTRMPRDGERDGVAYHFLSEAEFQTQVDNGAFLEWKQVHQHAYATPTASVEALLTAGRVAILKIDVQGAITVMEKRPDALGIFLMPPSQEELEMRIRSRGTDSEEAIRVRLANAQKEMDERWRYHYIAVNDELEACVQRMELYVAQAEKREPVSVVA